MLAFVYGFEGRAYQSEVFGICANGKGGLEGNLVCGIVEGCCWGEECKEGRNDKRMHHCEVRRRNCELLHPS